MTNSFPGYAEKENHIRKVQKSEERKVKNIEKMFNKDMQRLVSISFKFKTF